MGNLGLYEADPVAWRSMGALLSSPLDARASLCCGRCGSWAPGTHPNSCVTPRGWDWERHWQNCQPERRRNSPARWWFCLHIGTSPLNSMGSTSRCGKHSCCSSWPCQRKDNPKHRMQAWRWLGYGVQLMALFIRGQILILNWNWLNFLRSSELSQLFKYVSLIPS